MNILSLKGLRLKHAKTYQTTFESDTISDTLKEIGTSLETQG